MNVAIRKRLNGILSLAFKEDWSDSAFSLKKAHICAELSSIVYEEVKEYELKKSSRIHLFASERYRALVNSGKANSILGSVGDGGMDGQFFVVNGRYSIVFGTRINDVVILAVRGTVFRQLWDWKANLDSEKYFVYRDRYHYRHDIDSEGLDDQFFHRGFFESIAPQFSSIGDEIRKMGEPEDGFKIVWTGHSLGGAMAAIGNALHSRVASRKLYHEIPGESVGAYTFGMPRYSGLGAVCCFNGPHHIYKKSDIVPTVPHRKMGFADCCREYEITDTGTVELSERTDTFGVAGHIPKLLKSIKAHSIEGYADSVAKALGVSRP